MWIHIRRFYFNTDNLTYVQVEMDEVEHIPKKVHLHFTNEMDNFCLHHADAATFLTCLSALSCSDPDKEPQLEKELVTRGG